MKRSFTRILMASLLLLQFQTVSATEFESLKNALSKALGTTKAFQKTVAVGGEKVSIYYAKGDDGKATKLAIVQKALYKPDCTHTWVFGMNAADSTIDQIRVVEMKCPHAFPTNKAVFLDQYKGKGPADVKGLKGNINTIAKATYTSDYTTEAAVKSINAAVAFNKEAK